MSRFTRRARTLAPLGALVVLGLSIHPESPPRVLGQETAKDEALERTRAQVKMLDDLFKVAVVDITNRYEGPPAAKVAKAIFARAKEQKYFDAKLLDATGSPLNEANLPSDDFEKKAADAMNNGQTYLEQIVVQGNERRLRAATLVPAVVKKCATCHGVKEGDVLGFLSYDVPIR
jgi:hypothetical protein